MEDHHVDRPGVEAQQCVELTGTNSSIGLIVLINQCSLNKRTIHVPDQEVWNDRALGQADVLRHLVSMLELDQKIL